MTTIHGFGPNAAATEQVVEGLIASLVRPPLAMSAERRTEVVIPRGPRPGMDFPAMRYVATVNVFVEPTLVRVMMWLFDDRLDMTDARLIAEHLPALIEYRDALVAALEGLVVT